MRGSLSSEEVSASSQHATKQQYRLTSRSMFPNMRLPLLPTLKLMMRQALWPTPLYNILCSLALHDNFIRKSARLTHDQHIERVLKIRVVHHGVLRRVLAFQLHAPSAMLVKQQSAHGERVFMINWEISVLLGPAVEFSVPELDVGL